MIKAKKTLAVILTVLTILSTVFTVAYAANIYKVNTGTVNGVINKIGNEYSTELSNKISDLVFNSDYSDVISDRVTLRSTASIGRQAWPITNNDYFGTAVIDRGNTVNWRYYSAGCMSYACFFSYSVYGTVGARNAETVYLNGSNGSYVKDYLNRFAQPGEQIRIDNTHSIVYLTATEDGNGFYYCEYWGGNNPDWDQFYIDSITYDAFSAKYNGKNMFVFDAYETSEVATSTTSTVNPATVSRSLVILLDVSGSMYGSKLENTKTAAKKFVSDMLAGTTNTEIALVAYDSDIEVVSGFSKNETSLKKAIDSLDDGSCTNIYDAIEKADELLSQSSSAKKGIVLMTDGAANESKRISDGYRDTLDGTGRFYVDGYGAAIYDLCKSLKENKDYYIYTLGFGLYYNSEEYNLLANICSEGEPSKFVSVSNNNVNDISFAFDIINSNVTTTQRMYVVIECPVDVTVRYNGETLSSIGRSFGEKISAAFGSLTVNKAPNGDRTISLDLDTHEDYDFNIIGTGNGTMDMKVTYVNGDTSSFREFNKVPITPSTSIKTSGFDSRADLALYIDEQGDGKFDLGFDAAIDETVQSDSTDIIAGIYPAESYAIGNSSDSTVNNTSSAQDTGIFAKIINWINKLLNGLINLSALILSVSNGLLEC